MKMMKQRSEEEESALFSDHSSRVQRMKRVVKQKTKEVDSVVVAVVVV